MNIYPQSKIGSGLSLFSFWYASTYSNILYTYETKILDYKKMIKDLISKTIYVV